MPRESGVRNSAGLGTHIQARPSYGLWSSGIAAPLSTVRSEGASVDDALKTGLDDRMPGALLPRV